MAYFFLLFANARLDVPAKNSTRESPPRHAAQATRCGAKFSRSDGSLDKYIYAAVERKHENIDAVLKLMGRQGRKEQKRIIRHRHNAATILGARSIASSRWGISRLLRHK